MGAEGNGYFRVYEALNHPPLPKDSMTTTESTPTLTFGQRAVGLTFNPSGDDAVAQLRDVLAQRIALFDQVPA